MMINSEEEAKAAVVSTLDDQTKADQLVVTQVDGEPDYWLVSINDENGQPMMGGPAYVVNKEGKVHQTSGSLPPATRIDEAKASL